MSTAFASKFITQDGSSFRSSHNLKCFTIDVAPISGEQLLPYNVHILLIPITLCARTILTLLLLPNWPPSVSTEFQDYTLKITHTNSQWIRFILKVACLQSQKCDNIIKNFADLNLLKEIRKTVAMMLTRSVLTRKSPELITSAAANGREIPFGSHSSSRWNSSPQIMSNSCTSLSVSHQSRAFCDEQDSPNFSDGTPFAPQRTSKHSAPSSAILLSPQQVKLFICFQHNNFPANF